MKAKSHEADVKLGEGLAMGAVHLAHKKGIRHPGNHEGMNDKPRGMSDSEALGGKHQHHKVAIEAPMSKVQKKAHGFNERSQMGGAEKEGGW